MSCYESIDSARMEEKPSDVEKMDEVVLPGFRFHPTDEELVGFYLRRKIQQKPLSIEFIKQLDIYKYDPWDLPSEKEWYFYCPRDRKYRNSARPNRVTGAGFWKATGTDRPIYSSQGSKCIGLKKSLVFYKGRAAKGIKTDWMMHEFRLPSLTDVSSMPKKPLDKSIPPNDSWAICRLFKKTSSMAQRALSHPWVSSLPEATGKDTFSPSDNISFVADAGPAILFGGCNHICQQQQTAATATTTYPTLNATPYKPSNLGECKTSPLTISSSEIPTSFLFSHGVMPLPTASNGTADIASILGSLPPAIFRDVDKTSTTTDFGQQQQQCNSYTINFSGEMDENSGSGEEETYNNNQCGVAPAVSFPFNVMPSLSDAWRPNSPWDSPPCPSEVSASYSTKVLHLIG